MKMYDRPESDASDDDVPLKYSFTNDSNQKDSFRSLHQEGAYQCEFCERVFDNRYNSLIHNATHIIIPLINHKYIKCKECLFYFTSQSDYRRHMNRKHPTAIGNVSKTRRKDKRDDNNGMKNRLEFEEDLDITADLLKDLTTECKVTLDSISDKPLIELKNTNKSNVIEISDDEAPLVNNKLILGNHSTSKVFPVENGNVLNHKYVKSLDNGNVGRLFPESGEGVRVNSAYREEYIESVHYDELMVPMVLVCRHCKLKFPDRYNLVKHEASHLNFHRRQPRLCVTCDWYVADNDADLKRHRKTHPPWDRKKYGVYPATSKCLQCGLFYKSYIQHMRNYHFDISDDNKYDKIIRVCDLCYGFLKSDKKRSYKKVGTISEVGKRYRCGRCLRAFFELNTVRKTEAVMNWWVDKRRNKKLTNDQRLKNIQHRFKHINRMRKF